MTNAFFTELARCLRKQGIDSEIQKDSRLEVFLHGQPVLFISPKNEVFLFPEMSGNDEAATYTTKSRRYQTKYSPM